MNYYIVEERVIGKDGKLVPPSIFYVVDQFGKKMSANFDSLEMAIAELIRLNSCSNEPDCSDTPEVKNKGFKP